MIDRTAKDTKIDPRTKIITVMCISTMAVVIEDFVVLSLVLCLALICVYYFRGDLFLALKKMKYFIYIILGIVVLQSLFVSEGNVLVGTNSIKIITDVGLVKGVEFLLRMFIIILSGVILATSNTRYIIQGLKQWKVPYDIAFMVSLGIRFIPILLEEAKDTITAINLRGINIKKLRLKEKIELYSYILTPIVVSTLTRARQISISIEARGFRSYDKRTSILKLTMNKLDYFIVSLSLLITITIFFTYYLV